ncbi:MAG: hypothetical protein VX761_06120, partial [Planctomycetota bacterium]|nr:hypothetical protein [Planctomycetota bacterium]
MHFRRSKSIRDEDQSVGKDTSTGRSAGKRRPPPNYFSRKVQYKLFALVALLMTVVVTMERVSDPDLFRFFDEHTAVEVNSSTTASSGNSANPLFDPQLARFGNPLPPTASQASRDLQSTHHSLWTAILKKLTSAEQQTLVDTLHRARNGKRGNDQQQTNWWDLYQKIDLLYQKYEQQLMLSIHSTSTALTPEQKTRAQAVLSQLRTRWTQSLRKAFLDILETTPAQDPEANQNEYQFVQHILDQIGISRINDHTVFRNSDNLAWFRMLETLRTAAADRLQASVVVTPNILELSKQQDTFRGKLISMRGEIRKAYRVQAPTNQLDIQQYYVLVIRPSGGGTTPLIVYCLQPPTGFPALPDKDIDRSTADINDVVQVTGYFFKSWAHIGTQGQMHSSPLMLANSFQWLPHAQMPPTTSAKSAALLPVWALFAIPLILAIAFT